MRQLTYIGPKRLRWDMIEDPALTDPGSALVRPLAVARCDLDAVFLRHDVAGKLRLARLLRLLDPNVAEMVRPDLFKGPFPLGHECVAEVVETGADVTGFSPGDRVVIPFQVSCGSCPICSRGLTSQCDTYGPFDMYSGIGRHTRRGGMLADLVLVPSAQRMLISLPPSLGTIDLASASDNLPDAWCRVAPELLDHPGRSVLVVGGTTRSIGLYCVAFAVAMRAGRVDYLDRDAERRRIARTLGADVIEGTLRDVDRRYDLVVTGSSRASAIADAVPRLAPGGVCASATIHFGASVRVPYFPLYARNLTLKTGLANPMADLPAMLRFIAEHGVDVGAVTTRIADWDEAADAMLEDTTKVVVHRASAF